MGHRKPYCETFSHDGVIDAPIEQVWALHTDAKRMLIAFDRLVAMEVVSGRMGKIGCVVRVTLRSPRERMETTDVETIEAKAPRRLTTRTVVRQGEAATLVSTRLFTPEGNRTRTSLLTASETEPVRWLTRCILRLTRQGRNLLSTATFEHDLADENTYHAQHRDGPESH
jgi:hypothetical protein